MRVEFDDNYADRLLAISRLLNGPQRSPLSALSSVANLHPRRVDSPSLVARCATTHLRHPDTLQIWAARECVRQSLLQASPVARDSPYQSRSEPSASRFGALARTRFVPLRVADQTR